MKLTGEYQFINDGVFIEGQIHNTKIAQIREEMKEMRHMEMYCGETTMHLGKLYRVPSPDIFSHWKRTGVLSTKVLKESLGLKDYDTYPDVSIANDMYAAGIQFSSGSGYQLMVSKRIALYRQGVATNNKTVSAFNVPWVYAFTKADGTFQVTLNGIVNRHILTMLLGRATTFAKFLDGPVAKLIEDKNNLSASLRAPHSDWLEEVEP